MSVVEACRHLDRTLSELAAEYGEFDVIREPREVHPDDYDRLRDRAAAFDGLGGAGAWVTDPEGRVLLIRGGGGWAEPGATRRPGDDYADCARRAVRENAGLDARLTDLRHVHVRHCHDWTGRDPIPQLFVVFEGEAQGEPVPGEGVDGTAWHVYLPDDLLYDLLRELPIADRG